MNGDISIKDMVEDPVSREQQKQLFIQLTCAKASPWESNFLESIKKTVPSKISEKQAKVLWHIAKKNYVENVYNLFVF